MKEDEYNIRMEKLTNMKQFEPVEKSRINEVHPVIKKEERITDLLKKLKDRGKIDEPLYRRLKPRGSKPAQIYGLAKVHKNEIPLRPIVSIPGTSYDQIGKYVSKWLERVPESKINTSTED